MYTVCTHVCLYSHMYVAVFICLVEFIQDEHLALQASQQEVCYMYINQTRTGRRLARAWFLKIVL